MRKWLLAAVTACAACELVLDTRDLDNGKPTTDGGTPIVDGTTLAPVDAANPRDPSDAAHPADAAPDDAAVNAAENYRQTILADQPAGYWRLAEPFGAVTAKDEIGNHDGAYVSVMAGVKGPFTGGSGASFTSNFSRVELPDGFGYFASHAFTIEAWALAIAPDAGGCHHIFTREERDANHQGYGLLQYETGGVFLERFVSNSGESSQQGGLTVIPAANAFTHFVATYDGIVERLYVNGVLTTTGTTDTRSMPIFATELFIGAAGSNDCSWNGTLAEVAVYPTALGADRIAAHYAAKF